MATTLSARGTLTTRWDWAPIRRHPIATGFVAFAALAILSRLSMLHVPVDRDTGTFLYIGGDILDGHTPYAHAADNKGPVLFLVFALVRLVAGTDDVIVRLALVPFLALAALCVAAYVKRFAGLGAAIFAGVALSVLGSSERAGLEGSNVTGETFAIGPAAGAWYLATRGTVLTAAISGVLAAATSLMNLGFVVIIPFVLYELWVADGPASRVARYVAATAGGVVFSAAIAIWLGLGGALDDARVQIFGQATKTVGGQLSTVHRELLGNTPRPMLGLCLVGALGCAVAMTNPKLRRGAIVALMWIIVWFGRVKISPTGGNGGGAGEYYLAMPGVAAGLAFGMSVIWQRVQRAWGWGQLRMAAIAAFALAVAAVPFIVTPMIHDFRLPAGERRGPGEASETLAYPVADFIRSNTSSSDRIFVGGSDSEVYWLAHRKAPTRFFHVYPLFWDKSYAAERTHALLTHPPKAIVWIAGAGAREKQFAADVLYVIRNRGYRLAYDKSGARIWLRPLAQ